MKIIKYWILALVSVFSFSGNISAETDPPKISFNFFSGFATYKMGPLKQLNEFNEKNLPFAVRKINNFDPGFYMGGIIQTRLFANIEICLRYQYNTTGSRLGQKDYSGSYTFDQIVNGHLLGIGPEIIIDEKKHHRVSFSIMSGALFTKVKIDESLEVSGEEDRDTENLSAFSVPVFPSLNLSIDLLDWLSGSLSAGYFLDTGGKVHLKNERDAVLMVNDESVKTEWSGWRIALGLKFKIIN